MRYAVFVVLAVASIVAAQTTPYLYLHYREHAVTNQNLDRIDAALRVLATTTTTTTSGSSTTTLPGCPTPDGSSCGGGDCDTGLCLARIPGTTPLCVDGGTCDVVTCASDTDCSAGKFCVDASPLGPPTACCQFCGSVATTTSTTTTTLPPCNVTVWCDLCDDQPPVTCTSDGDCNPGFVCHAPTGEPTKECVKQICVVGSTIGCIDSGAADTICGGSPCGGGSPPPDCGQPCTVNADCGAGEVCVSAVDRTGPNGYQDQCKAACGMNATVANCATGACDCTSTTTTTTSTTTATT